MAENKKKRKTKNEKDTCENIENAVNANLSDSNMCENKTELEKPNEVVEHDDSSKNKDEATVENGGMKIIRHFTNIWNGVVMD